jgi:hypothetical protein
MTVAAALVAAAASATIAFVAGAGSDPRATAQRTPTDRSPFAIFDLPAAPHSGDTLPIPPGAPRLTRQDPHRLSVEGHDVWVTSGNRTACVVLATDPRNEAASATACGALSDAEANGLFLTSRAAPGASGAQWQLAGLIPDDIDQVQVTLEGGDTKLLQPVHNVVVAVLDATPILARFTSADGRDHVQKLGAL